MNWIRHSCSKPNYGKVSLKPTGLVLEKIELGVSKAQVCNIFTVQVILG
jgi:hypothetical protein